MLRKLKQKGESSILHWMLREGFLIRSFTIRDLKEVREHGRGRAFQSEEAANVKARCE